MSTLTQTLTPRDWLERGNQVRRERAQLRVELAAGVIEIADAIHDPRSGSLTIYDFLRSIRGIGKTKAAKIPNRLLISSNRRCDQLTLRQKGLIVAEVVQCSR